MSPSCRVYEAELCLPENAHHGESDTGVAARRLDDGLSRPELPRLLGHKPLFLEQALFSLALSTVGGFIKRKRETGSVSPDKFGGYKTFSLEPHADLVKEFVAEQPDITLAELQVRLAKENVKVSHSAISRFLHHIKLTFKKRLYTQPNKIGQMSPRPVKPCRKSS
jgi:transposase